MERKKLNSKEIASIKRVAQNVDADLSKYNKLYAEIQEKQAEMEDIKERIDLYEAPVKRATGGFTSSDLVQKVVSEAVNEDGTPKYDKKTGKVIKVTKYVLRYPDTVYPPEPEENDHPFVVPNGQDLPGSDFDGDKEKLEETANNTSDWEPFNN